MTVKCLPEIDKIEIAQLYASKLMSSDELSKSYSVSRRTINRVLVEQGVARTRVYKGRTIVEPVAPEAMPDHHLPELTLWEKIKVFFKVANPFVQKTNVQPRA